MQQFLRGQPAKNDPAADAAEWSFLNEDLLLLANTQPRVLIDVSWMPSGPRGRFVLSAVDWVGAAQMPESRGAPLMQFRSRSRAAIVQKLESWASLENWGTIKDKRRRQRDSIAVPLKTSYVRNQKLYEAEV